MIVKSDKYYIDIEMEGFGNARLGNFYKLIFEEVAGLVLPIFELDLIDETFFMLPYLRRNNTTIKLKYGQSMDSANTYELNVSNYNYVKKEGIGGYILSLTGLVKLKEYTNKSRIQYKEGTSDAVLSSITTLTPEINYSGDDSQVWLQHNTSDKDYVKEIVSHAYCKENDAIVGAITVDKQLIVKSLDTAFNKDSVVTKFCNSNPNQNSITYDRFHIESDSALWNDKLSEGKQLKIISVSGRVNSVKAPVLKSLVDNKSNDDETENVDFTTIIDCGNCHKNYYQAWLNNIAIPIQMNRVNIFLYVSKSFVNNDRLKLLDVVEFTPLSNDYLKTADSISGKYIVTEKITNVDNDGVRYRFKIARDYNLEAEEKEG